VGVVASIEGTLDVATSVVVGEDVVGDETAEIAIPIEPTEEATVEPTQEPAEEPASSEGKK